MKQAFAHFIILGLFFVSVAASAQIKYYVDPVKGSDLNDGSLSSPLKTIEKAQAIVRKSAGSANSDIEVLLRGGVYNIDKTIQFNESDGGVDNRVVRYKAYPNERPVVSGGKKISGWKAVEGKKYFKANVPVKDGFASYFRQLYVNGRRVQQAKSYFIHVAPMPYDDPKTPEIWDGYIVKTADIKKYTNLENVRIFQEGDFKHVELFIKQIMPISDTESAIVMKQSAFYDWTKTYVYNNLIQIRVINAFEELDEPGEFYLDQQNQIVYYYPQPGEDINKAAIVAPAVETLVNLSGSESKPLKNLIFDGITFEYGNWTAPDKKEFGRSQADLYPDYTAIEGQFNLKYTENIGIQNCQFNYMASSGIYLSRNNRNTTIQGNVFKDLTAAAILVGEDLKDTEKVNVNTLISNNVIRAIGADFFQASGIYANTSKDMIISHNDVADIAYFGINQRYYGGSEKAPSDFVGNTLIDRNKVSDFSTGSRYGFGIGDEVGGFYFFGVKDSKFTNNYATYGGKSEFLEGAFRQDGYGYNNLFMNNVADCKPAKRSFSASPEDKPGNLRFINNYSNEKIEQRYGADLFVNQHYEKDAPKWSDSAQIIIDNAGLEKPYKSLLKRMNGGENIALKAKITTSDKGNEKTLSAVIDNNISSSWSVSQAGKLNWICLELDGMYAVDKLQILPVYGTNDPESRRCFEVQVSNDHTFATYNVIGGQNEVPFAYNASPQTKTTPLAYNTWDIYGDGSEGFKYLRVVGRKLSLSELRLYGHTTKEAGIAPFSKQMVISAWDKTPVAKVKTADDYVWSKKCETRVPFTADVRYWHSWWFPNQNKLTKMNDTLKLETPGGSLAFRGGCFGNEKIKFNLKLVGSEKAEHYISFRGNSNTKSYAEQECYFLVFRRMQIKLLKTTKDFSQVLLIGTEGDKTGKLGVGLPAKKSIYEKIQPVEIETANVKDGVRIILRVAGETVLDCVDNTTGFITRPGFMSFKVRPDGCFLMKD